MMIQRNTIICHIFIIIFLSKHRSNHDNPLTPKRLIKTLKEYKRAVITNVHRQMTPNVSGRLVETGPLIIKVAINEPQKKLRTKNNLKV